MVYGNEGAGVVDGGFLPDLVHDLGLGVRGCGIHGGGRWRVGLILEEVFKA